MAHRQTNGAHRPVLQLCSCPALPLSPPACLSIQALRLLFYLLHSFRRQSVCVGNDKKAHHDSTGPGAKLVPTRPCVAPLFSAFSLALPLLSSTRCTVYPAVVATKRYFYVSVLDTGCQPLEDETIACNVSTLYQKKNKETQTHIT